MTPQEQQLLQDLTARINQTTLPEKDPEAEQFLTQSLGRNPDSLYILAQTILVQNYALDQARQQITQLKQQAQQPPLPEKHTSFLGNLLGMDTKPTPPPPPPQQSQYAPVQNTGYPQQPQYAQPQYPPQQQPSGMFGGGMGMGRGGGFLRTAATTAAGVAAGALAFEGIESLMHGFGNHAGYGQNFGGFGEGQPREEVINNYYGDSDRSDRGGDLSDRFAAAGDSPSDDIEDRRGFADTDSTDDNDQDTDNSADDFTTDSADDFSSDDTDNS